MCKIKDVLRLKFEGELSHQQIATALKLSKGVVTKYVGLAVAAGLDWAAVCEIEEVELRQRLLPQAGKTTGFVVPDYGHIHQELRRKGVTLFLLWEEYQSHYAGQSTWRYTQFCKHYRKFALSLKRSMRQIHRAGEKLFIDFAGPTLGLVDGSRIHIYVAALGASSYTFACATLRETMVDWIESTVKAFSFIGGATQRVIPDNPRGDDRRAGSLRAAQQ